MTPAGLTDGLNPAVSGAVSGARSSGAGRRRRRDDELQAPVRFRRQRHTGGRAEAEAVGAAVGPTPVFNRIGVMTRQLHDTLRELGYDRSLQGGRPRHPDARQRLSYISEMTEQAASKVLNATDIAKPIQDRSKPAPRACAPAGTASTPTSSAGRVPPWRDPRRVPGRRRQRPAETNAQLLEIMMAQDFRISPGR